jgi:hypothetical protein
MKNLLFIIATLLLLQSCKDDVQPEPEKQYSYWKVNGENFKSNNISIGIGKVRSGFSSQDLANRFGLTFYLPYLPTNEEWPIVSNNVQQNSNLAELGFWYQGQPYGISIHENNNLIASKVNNKASYYLEPTWFVNTGNVNDSVLIEGTFNEP